MTAISFASPEPELYPPLPFAPDTPPQEIWGTLYNKFYDWKYHECLSVLDGLKTYPTNQDDDDRNEEHDSGPYPSIATRTNNRSRGIDTEYFEIVTFDGEEEETNSTQVEVIVEDGPSDRRLNRSWAPNPRYTTCTPLHSNIANTKNLDNDYVTILFPHFSDDPAFNLPKYLAFHERLAWQTDFWDPDHEIIKLETVRLLHFQQGLSLQDIDDLRLPTLPKIRLGSTDGLIWQASQRDILYWPESQMSPWPQLTLGYATSNYSNTGQDFFSQIQYGSTVFCPNLGCLTSSSQVCEMHRVPGIREQNSTITSTEYGDGAHCGDRCFLGLKDAISDEEARDALIWPDGTSELETVQGALKLVPDALPCDLAVICRLPCDQVFANRRKLYPDQDILEERTADPVPDRVPIKYWDVPREVPVSDDPSENKFIFSRIPPAPCSHAGPCRKNVCSCFDEGYHCERNCRCSRECPNRWKGCKCKHPKHKSKHSGTNESCSWFGVEGPSQCPCVETLRECDPEVCLGCGGKKGRKCQNKGVQRGRFPRLEISRSQWGYGAYAAETILPGTWVGDYVGDMEYSSTTHSLGDSTVMIRDHTGLNYAFELAEGIAIDSMVAGNETRYLNHSHDPEKFNCGAQTRLIRNTLHVALYANTKIALGQELLLNYGEEYWNNQN